MVASNAIFFNPIPSEIFLSRKIALGLHDLREFIFLRQGLSGFTKYFIVKKSLNKVLFCSCFFVFLVHSYSEHKSVRFRNKFGTGCHGCFRVAMKEEL